jgi:antitoxin component of MazEF toxin-antitoxin module
MKKALSRTGGKTWKTISMPKTRREPVDLAAVRQEIRQAVSSEAVKMVRRIIKEVDISHYTSMKYLFELAGLYPATPQEETAGGDSLAKTLLSRLGLEESPMVESVVKNDREMEPQRVRPMP